MPALSPNAAAEGVLRTVLLCNGREVSDSVGIVSIQVRRAMNQVPSATLVLRDGDLPQQVFPTSDADTFVPGTEVEVQAGYGDSQQTLFKGVVVKHALQIQGSNDTCLTLECRDKAIRLTVGRRSQVWADTTDGDLLSGLVRAHGLQAQVDATAVRHRSLVQHGCTDWDFLLSRAQANGLMVMPQDGLLKVTAPRTDAAAVLGVSWGEDLIEFQAELDATDQFSAVQATAWDPSTQALVAGAEAGPQTLTPQGNLQAAELAQVLGLGRIGLQAQVPLSAEELGGWAKAQQFQSALARVRGHVHFQGSALAQVGAIVSLNGVGTRFSGNVLTTALTHTLSEGQWLTRVEFGHEMPGAEASPHRVASAPVPGMEGLHAGVIVALAGDPQGQHRVQVNVPSAGLHGVWARLAQVQASSGFGACFVPELGDEVLLGWLGNDPAYPVVLGSLHSSLHPPPFELQDDNPTRAIVTRCKSRLEFNDADQAITLTTPAHNRVVISDKEQRITLTDQHGNRVELSPSGITLDSPKDIRISAKGQIALDAVAGVAIRSPADVKLDGLNVSCAAQVAFTGKGAASAELSASGQTTVKGAMVMIN